VEGETQDEEINRLRRRQRLNLMATLLFSKGTPMLLAGDEFGNSQGGNNNAYAQDNETGWLDWSGLESDPDFLSQVRKLVSLRKRMPHLKRAAYLHAHDSNGEGWLGIDWLHPGGKPMHVEQWLREHALTLLFSDVDHSEERFDKRPGHGHSAVAIMLNADTDSMEFSLPELLPGGQWNVEFYSADSGLEQTGPSTWRLLPRSVACAFLTVAVAS
jgi:glycogen operon protein